MEYRMFENIKDISLQDESIPAQNLVYHLWSECFLDTVSYTDFYFKWKMKDNQVFSVFKGDRISAMLHLNPYTISVGGKQTPAYYIVGVATKEEDRRQGLMKRLLEKAMLQMNEEKMPFTYLMPAKEAIYLPFGFRIVYEQENYKKLIQKAKDKDSQTKLIEIRAKDLQVFDLEPTDALNIAKVVEFTNTQLAMTQDIFVYRDEYYYQRLIHEMRSSNGEVMFIIHKEEMIGYIAYMKETDLAVAEAIYLPDKKEDFFNKVSENLGAYSEEEKDHTPPTIMARIINFNSFISGMTANQETSLIIRVRDPIIGSNEGIYEVTFTPHGSHVSRCDKMPEIEGDIADLTKLFFGQGMKDVKDSISEKLNHINCYKRVFINDVV